MNTGVLYLATLIAVVFVCPISVQAFSYGAPEYECGPMLPDHGYSNQLTPSPFRIDILNSGQAYKKQQTVQLQLSGSVTFKGFLLQARRAAPNATNALDVVGNITTPSGTMSVCAGPYGHGVTHTDSTLKNNFNLAWTAPSDPDFFGPIVFVATFVQQYDIIYTSVYSVILYEENNPSQQLNATPPMPYSTAFMNPIRMAPCGITKGCMGYPRGCTCATCQVFATWQRQNDTVRFELSAIVGPQSWVAIGFSDDTWMGNDSTTHCIIDQNGYVDIGLSYNQAEPSSRLYNFDYNAKYNFPLDVPFGVTNASGAYVDGQLICSFNRAINASIRIPLIFDLNHNYYLQLAYGNAIEGHLLRHLETPIVSDRMVDVTTNFNIEVAGAVKYAVVRAHACMMLTAWMLFASVGIIFARYYKDFMPDRTIMGTKIWFSLHRILQLANLLFTTIGFIIIFCGIYDYSQNNLHGLPGYQQAHPVIGIAVMILVVLNPVMAAFRPHPDEKTRPIFNWFHFGVGMSAHFLGVLNIFFGHFLPKAVPFRQGAFFWLMIAFCAVQLCAMTILEVHKWLMKARTGSMSLRKDTMSMDDVGHSRPSSRLDLITSSIWEFSVHHFVLILYLPAMVSLWLAMIILMGANFD